MDDVAANVAYNRSIATINATLQLLYIDEASKNVTRWDNIG